MYLLRSAEKKKDFGEAVISQTSGVGSPECAAPRTATGDQPGGGREGGRETCEMHQRDSESAAWQEMLIGLSYGALAPEKESGK